MKKFDLILSAVIFAASLTSCSDASEVKSSDESLIDSTETGIEADSSDKDSETKAPVEKTEITLGMDEYFFDLAECADKFNATDSPYKIVLKDYSDSDKTITEVYNDMKLDIVSGKSPDMIVCTDSSFYSILSRKGLFADVSGIYDDTDVLPNIKKMCTEENGQIYRVPLGFSVKTACSAAENAAECCKIYDYKAMEKTVGDLGAGEVLAYDMMSAEESARISLINDFTDLKGHTCNFDSQEFIKALEFYKYTKENKHSEGSGMRAKILYLSIGNAAGIYSMKKENIGNGEVVLTPSKDARAELNMSLTISSLADESAQKGAEEFIKFILSNNCINTEYSVYFPITKSGLDIALAADIGFLDDSGDKQTIQLDDKEQAHYREYITSVDSENVCDRTIMYIFMEEAERYINGECTAQQCAEYIQDRASLYLSEQG